MHKGKKLEKYLVEVFRKIPGVRQVKENGSGWRSDNGADLIITMNYSLGNIVELGHTIIVQVKSYDGEHYDTTAVEQVKKGIQTYNASAGMLITTAKKTETLENAVIKASNDQDVPIGLLASDDIVKLIIEHAPDLLFRLKLISFYSLFL